MELAGSSLVQAAGRAVRQFKRDKALADLTVYPSARMGSANPAFSALPLIEAEKETGMEAATLDRESAETTADADSPLTRREAQEAGEHSSQAAVDADSGKGDSAA
ncbi:hypothetical protein GCM10010917_18040 [Paenibacillus physcomitrellae]|uniref:Uncharacterized protein n=1 Tax=Paenibacillus physcomitrellae TaxID=1619311 RepID=A0ABQ1FYV7_9BACL|nr:hypothetical protein GCM10010917_18040 [Paenibacillus physcomitrellae]